MFSLESLRALASAPDGRIGALETAGMIRPIGSDYLFAHALIHQAVYSSLLTKTRRELHARCARWFAGTEPILHAQHLDRAEHPEAAQAYLAASRAEAERFRFDSALRLVARATALAPAADLGCTLALLQGELLRETGQSKDSILAFRRALDLAQQDDARCHAWMGIAAGQRVTGELAAAMEALDRAQHIAEHAGLSAERSRIHHTRGNLCFVRGETAACEAEHQQALDLARLAGDLECEVHALGGMADAHYAQARIATALTYFQRCVAISGEQGWIGIETSNRCMAAVCLWFLGDLTAGIVELRRACEDSRRIGAVPVQLLAVDTLAILLLEAGRFDEAERCCMEGLALAQTAGSGRYESLLLWNLGSCHIARGDQEAARRCLDDSLALARQTGLGSMGPAIYARLARAASSPAERMQALHEGECLLQGPCLAHATLSFYREAIEASIAAHDWDRTSRYASELESFFRNEPLHWAKLIVLRAEGLKEAALHEGSREPLRRLEALREQVVAAGWASALVEIDARLATRHALR
jgi:tetratricopeptide (TPR) repeat protein